MADDIRAVIDVEDDVVNVFGNADAYFEVVVTSTFGSIDLIDGAQNFDGEASIKVVGFQRIDQCDADTVPVGKSRFWSLERPAMLR